MANKALAQHWLFDKQVLSKVASAAEVASADTVLEIGPGLGTLTEVLQAKAKHVVAVEKDKLLAEDLKRKLSDKNLEIISGDILEFDLRKMPTGYKVVANIPYYLTSRLLKVLLESINPPVNMSILIQKEVAQRITAKPGDMSVLAFSIQYYGEPQIVQEVPRQLFKPVPAVDSAILLIKRREKPLFAADAKRLFRLVKAGFGARRKQLKNSLAGGLRISEGEAKRMLIAAKLNPLVRAQELSLLEWQMLYKVALSSKSI